MLLYRHHIFSEKGESFKLFLYTLSFTSTKSGRFKKQVYSKDRGLESRFEYAEKLPILMQVIDCENNDLIAFDIWAKKAFELQDLLDLCKSQVIDLLLKNKQKLNKKIDCLDELQVNLSFPIMQILNQM